MKTKHERILGALNKTEMSSLLKEVKETLAIGADHEMKIFSSAELWNIQRRRRILFDRRSRL
ncbi:MAG TPA: hypothetical protein PLC48_00790 [Ferruginibacter sp.]|nr:hypothetical protein [Ferruginibacter sp.]